MATHNVIVENHGASDVVVAGGTARKGQATTLTLSDATTDAYLLADGGCVVGGASSKTQCPQCGYQHTVGEVRLSEAVTGNERQPVEPSTSKGYLP